MILNDFELSYDYSGYSWSEKTIIKQMLLATDVKSEDMYFTR